MFNLLAANLHDSDAHDLASSLGLIGNSFQLPGKNRFLQTPIAGFGKKSGFNIPNMEHIMKAEDHVFHQACTALDATRPQIKRMTKKYPERKSGVEMWKYIAVLLHIVVF